MGSLETSTVLFTDLVGSTGLATRVGPGAAESLRRDHFAILRGAVEATGGREAKTGGGGGQDSRRGVLRDLRGPREPFPAQEVGWQPAGAPAHTLPLPPGLREVPPVGYVGRDVEREGLTFLFDQVREGARRVALISDEPGIGKTRLATQLAVHGHGDGATELYGRCDEDLGVPYGPW